MLTPFEKMLFLLLALFALGATYNGFEQMWRLIQRGQGKLVLDNLPARAAGVLVIYITQNTTMRARRVTSLFHLAVVWGFTLYFLVNLGDLLEGFIRGYRFLGQTGILFDVYRLAADVLSVAVIVGVIYFVLRRFVLPNKDELIYRENVLLHPAVKTGGITTDSAIVAFFILFHVGSRFLGQSVHVAASGSPDLFRPFATVVSVLWVGSTQDTLRMLEHVFWWGAIGSLTLFIPYFPYSKHAHLFMAPLNFLTRPARTSLGEMEKLDLDDETREQFGAAKLEHLTKTNLFDGFACIMCNRCQDACPAYATGKELSPAAYEVNKRFMFKDAMRAQTDGAESTPPLLGFAISESALWACTTCGACIDICPVGNEPMLDILDIRRDAVLTQNQFPDALGNAFDGMERRGNPWGIAEERMKWATGLDFPVPTVDENPNFELLYWVGCAASYDARAQLTARALVRILHRAGVNFAVLGERETCTGDSARRAGNEYLYQQLAAQNVETLNAVKPKRIVATCPHCLHNLGKEYHQFGGRCDVVHHTELIDELIAAGKLPESARAGKQPNVTFHDPCYLGRHNGVIDAPRAALTGIGAQVVEMPRSGRHSFCCGAGGAQFWKEEEHGTTSVSVARYEEANATGAGTVVVGCPFCMQMFESARTTVGGSMDIKDVAELVAEGL